MRVLALVAATVFGIIPSIVADTPKSCPAPPPTGNYEPTFFNLTGAVNAPGYMTYKFCDFVDQCLQFCNAMPGCRFVNTYHDVNGKGGDPRLTGSFYTECAGPELAVNRGGQSQPDGSISRIEQSSGWCKDI